MFAEDTAYDSAPELDRLLNIPNTHQKHRHIRNFSYKKTQVHLKCLSEKKMQRDNFSIWKSNYAHHLAKGSTVTTTSDRASHRLLNDFMKFMQQVSEGVFPLDNIALRLFLEIVKWYTCKSTTEMEYSEDSK